MSDLTALSKKIGFQIDDMKGLIEKIISDPKNGATSDKVAGSVWEEAMKRIEDKVLPAIKKDLSKLKSSGLIPEGAVLKGIKFSGSDFHKGGNQVLFLRFEEGGKEKKIAYKPSSLMVDSLLFGQGGVASKLGAISTYNIVAAQSNDKPPKDLGYGYMEFVDTQGGPQTGQDVMKVYKSTAAAMAMSYYAGLEDVHNENVLLKKDSVQVIDMEATTGMFPMPQGPHQGFVGGFIDQQWNKAINDGLKKTLISAIQAKKLTSLPKTADIEKEMVAQFEAVLTKMQDKSLATDLKALEQSLAGQRTRIVPIETRAFQDEKEGMIVLAQKPKYPIKGKNEDASFDTWKRFVEENLEKDIKLEQGAKPPETLFKTVRATTTTPLKTLRNLLVSKGVYNALRRGDVPYYYRDLGSSDVFDEEDNKIDATGHKKVGIGIAKEMETRRAADTKQIVAVFKAQAVRMVNDVNNSLAEFLKAVPQG
jgi:hypothetical protein